MTLDYRKLFRVVLTSPAKSVTGMGRTMAQAYGDAVRQHPDHDWRPVFDQARKAFKRDVMKMSLEIVSDDLRVEIKRPWL